MYVLVYMYLSVNMSCLRVDGTFGSCDLTSIFIMHPSRVEEQEGSYYGGHIIVSPLSNHNDNYKHESVSALGKSRYLGL